MYTPFHCVELNETGLAPIHCAKLNNIQSLEMKVESETPVVYLGKNGWYYVVVQYWFDAFITLHQYCAANVNCLEVWNQL